MKIHSSAWHYRYYCWLWNHASLKDGDPKLPINLCQYMRFLIFRSLFAPYLWIIVLAMFIYTLIGTVVRFLWCTVIFRTSAPHHFQGFPPNRGEKFDLFSYRPITKAPGWGGWIPLVILPYFLAYQHGNLNKWWTTTWQVFLGLILFVVCCWLMVTLSEFRHSETGELLGSYIKAKKKKVCPFLELVDNDAVSKR